MFLGDPEQLIHPVQVMGFLINKLKSLALFIAKDNHFLLRLSGVLIALLIFTLSFTTGFLIEQLCLQKGIGASILIICIASSISSKSLIDGMSKVLNLIRGCNSEEKLINARNQLRKIVGRDVESLSKKEILRAIAETGSENSVDGIFAPIFWIFIGAISWNFSLSIPGPLAFAWAFKSSSTMDSMLGYKRGELQWLGTASAYLDDWLTYFPCRLVVLTLPLITKDWMNSPQIIRQTFKEGSKDSSPNSGLSEAIFAHCARIKMGGTNYYKEYLVKKPLLAINAPEANPRSIKSLISLIHRLQLAWTLLITLILLMLK